MSCLELLIVWILSGLIFNQCAKTLKLRILKKLVDDILLHNDFVLLNLNIEHLIIGLYQLLLRNQSHLHFHFLKLFFSLVLSFANFIRFEQFSFFDHLNEILFVLLIVQPWFKCFKLRWESVCYQLSIGHMLLEFFFLIFFVIIFLNFVIESQNRIS